MATDTRARHGRQIRLAEIGEAGQARLMSADVVLGGAGEARAVEATYLARAGVHVVDDAKAEALARTKAFADGTEKRRVEALASLGLKDSVAREVGDGALRALLAMRKVLGIEGTGGGEA